jgi:hypothetical protein
VILIANPCQGHEGRQWMARWRFKLCLAWVSQGGAAAHD